jgi:hypothetical protein
VNHHAGCQKFGYFNILNAISPKAICWCIK